jgi:uncharacterized lipoprotein YehR (DUF1307 family)
MDKQKAEREGLSYLSHFLSDKEKAKSYISSIREKYKGNKIRVILVTEIYRQRVYGKEYNYYAFCNELCGALVLKDHINTDGIESHYRILNQIKLNYEESVAKENVRWDTQLTELKKLEDIIKKSQEN